MKIKVSLLSLFVAIGVSAEEATPGYNHKIPEKIMTPDTVETSIGTLEFFDGMPKPDTVDVLYTNLFRSRAMETFLNGIPATSIEGLLEGMESIGADSSNKVVIFDKLLDSSPLFLTGNTDTVYASAFVNLQEEGPMVVEIPPHCGPGTVNDAFFRFVTDMGIPGPDAGKGGKYLILPPDYEGEIEGKIGSEKAEVNGEEFYVSQSPSYVNWIILRGFLVDGKPDAASEMFKSHLKIYPLSKAANPPEMEFISGSGKSFNTIHANDYDFYAELGTVIQREPVDFIEPQLRGLFASVGIEKGKPFNPSAEEKKMLADGVAIGNATARALMFRSELDDVSYYPDSGWKAAFIGGSYQWLKDGGLGGRFLDARTYYFYQATVNTPAMVLKMVGKGSQYAVNYTDKEGEYLDGSKHYQLTIPANVPAANFWSVVVYDPQTRSELQTSQPFPSRNNKRDNLVENEDGSVTLYFGPTAPEGKESNWIQSVPNKGWFTILRLYGPLDPWFNKTWRPGEIELVK
tara:strand:+ start:1374 stop:2921 length:1548 start_codon:yes stop_codon:yes gene_type:complete